MSLLYSQHSDPGAEDCRGGQSGCKPSSLSMEGYGSCTLLPHPPTLPRSRWVPSVAPRMTWQLPDLSVQGRETSD